MLQKKGVLFLVLLLSSVTAFAIQSVTAVLAPRPGLALNTNTGLYVDLLRKIFPTSDYDLVFEYVPLNTALGMVSSGKADITIDYIYDPDKKDLLYSDEKLTAEPVEAIYSKASLVQWNGQDPLKDQAVGMFFSYPFDRLLNVSVKRQEYRVLEVAMKQVLSQDLPFLIDFKWDIEKTAQDNFLDLGKLNQAILFEVDTYFAFGKSSQGKELKKVFEKRFESLKEDGELESLFKSYGKELID